MDATSQPMDGQSPALFAWCNRTRTRCYLANLLTLGLYGALYVIFRTRSIGAMAGATLPGPGASLVWTLVTLGVYPGVMLSVLAFLLRPVLGSTVGWVILAFNLASLVIAVISGGVFIFISTALWAHAVWLLAEAEQVVITRGSG